MANALAIPRLTATDAVTTPVNPGMVPLTASSLGDFGTDADGFEAFFNPVPLAVDADHAAVLTLADHLVPMDFADGQFSADNVAPVGAAIQPFLDAGDALASNVGIAVAPPAPPPPPPPPPPPVDVGGGPPIDIVGGLIGGIPCIDPEDPLCELGILR